MEVEIKKPMRIKIEDFNSFLEKQLMLKYSAGIEGLKDRFQTLMVIFKDIMQFTQDINDIVNI